SGSEAIANLHALHRIDAHQRNSEISVKLAIDRCAKTDGNTRGDKLNHRTAGGAAFAHAIKIGFPVLRGLCIRAAEGNVLRFCPVPVVAVYLVRTHLYQRTAYGDGLAKDRAGNSTGSNTRRRLARRRAPAAAMIADAIFSEIGEVGMAGPELLDDVAIVFRALIDILDHQRNRRAGGEFHPVLDKGAREDFHLIRLAALRGEA